MLSIHSVNCNFNQAVCALRFLYRHTLGRDWAVAHIPFPRQPQKLPVVLSQTEVIRLFDAVRSLKHPFGGPEQVLAYLGRYTHRVAISNQRLLALKTATLL